MDDTRARTPRDVQRLGDERSKSITNRTDSQGRRGRNHVVCIEGVVEVVVEVDVEEEERGRRQVTTRNARVYRLVIDSRVQCSELDASKVIPLLQVPKIGGETRRQERERGEENLAGCWGIEMKQNLIYQFCYIAAATSDCAFEARYCVLARDHGAQPSSHPP